MPEITENYIRIPAREGGDFEAGSMRTITLSAEQGIKAIIGRLQGETKTTVRTYLFVKEKWTMERAKAWVAEHKEGKALVDLLFEEAYKAEGEREQAREAQKARASRYNISPKEGGNLTPPAGYPGDDGDYGDPVNYRYPIDREHIKPAIAYFNQDGQREDGGYSEAEWAIVGKRIASRASSLIAEGYAYDGGKVARKQEGKSLAIKTLSEDAQGVTTGGYLLLWGDEQHKDLQKQYFTKSTELWLDKLPVVPALFHHGLDPTVDLTVVGRRIKAQVDGQGVWVEHWLDKSSKYWSWLEPLLRAEALYLSPGSAGHLVRVAQKSGELLSYPVVEDTLTPIPAQHRLRPVEQIKAAYKCLDLAPPTDLGGESADALSLETERERVRALKLAIELSRARFDLST